MIVLPAIVLLFYVTASLHFSYTPDDTYIYLQFAKNVSHGDGISFNAGEPTYGITSPLWLGFIAFGGMLGVDLYVAAKALDLVLASLALVAFFLLAFEVTRNIIVALLATAAFSANAWMLRWAGTGMETSLSVLLVLLSLWFCLRNEYLISTVTAGLATHVRPETSFLLVLILFDCYINSVDKIRGRKMIGKLVLVFVVLLAPWMIYARLTFGSIVPNTALAKSGLRFDAGDFVYTLKHIFGTLALSDGLSIAAILFCGLLFVFMKRKSLSWIKSPDQAERFFLFRQSFIGIGWILFVIVSYASTGVNVVSRYLLLIIPLIVIFSYSFLYQVISNSKWKSYVYAAVMVFTGALILQNQIVYWKLVNPGIQAFEQGMETCLIPIGKWLKNNTAPESIVFVPDVGAIGYYSDRKICDAAGLVSPSLLPFVRRGDSFKKMVEERMYQTACAANYVVFRSFESEEWNPPPELTPLFTKQMPRMSLSEVRPTLYTVYEVGQQSSSPKNSVQQ